jgi:hypothetical protein
LHENFAAPKLQSKHGNTSKGNLACLDLCRLAPWPNVGTNVHAMHWMRRRNTKVVATSIQALAIGSTFLLDEKSCGGIFCLNFITEFFFLLCTNKKTKHKLPSSHIYEHHLITSQKRLGSFLHCA